MTHLSIFFPQKDNYIPITNSDGNNNNNNENKKKEKSAKVTKNHKNHKFGGPSQPRSQTTPQREIHKAQGDAKVSQPVSQAFTG